MYHTVRDIHGELLESVEGRHMIGGTGILGGPSRMRRVGSAPGMVMCRVRHGASGGAAQFAMR
jgi:hypothetical protein